MPRWRAHRTGKRDRNHKEIQDGLKKKGFVCFDTTRVGYGFPDLIVNYNKRIILFEIKDGKGGLNELEEAFFQTWPGEVYMIRSLEEALLVLEKSSS